MNCEDPYVKDGHAFGCGRCMPCRINKKRVWQHRIMLEAAQHGDNCFVTLTYRPEDCPPQLVPKDITDFLKLLRFNYHPKKLRYFAVGEYGDITERPHYHLALFGFPGCLRGQTKRQKTWTGCCYPCDLIHGSWNKGQIMVGELNSDSAQYVSGYTTKKMTKADDFRLKGRHPEFARMSLKPGIGADFIPKIAAVITRYDLLSPSGDVPVTLGHGDQQLPLGLYLRRKLRKAMGRDEKRPPLHAVTPTEKEMLYVRLIALDTSLTASEKLRLQLDARKRIQKHQEESKQENLARVQQVKAREKIFAPTKGKF